MSLAGSASAVAISWTACGVDQFVGVNVSVAPEATRMSGSPELRVVVTSISSAGSVARQRFKVVVPPSIIRTTVGVAINSGPEKFV